MAMFEYNRSNKRKSDIIYQVVLGIFKSVLVLEKSVHLLFICFHRSQRWNVGDVGRCFNQSVYFLFKCKLYVPSFCDRSFLTRDKFFIWSIHQIQIYRVLAFCYDACVL